MTHTLVGMATLKSCTRKEEMMATSVRTTYFAVRALIAEVLWVPCEARGPAFVHFWGHNPTR